MTLLRMYFHLKDWFVVITFLMSLILKLMEIFFIPALLIILGLVLDFPKLYYRISIGIYFVLWLVYVIFLKG